MFRVLFSRWLVSSSTTDVGRPTSLRRFVVESAPPSAFSERRAWSSRLGDWLAGSGWRASGIELPSSLQRRARRAAMASAQLDFAEALFDVRTDAAADALDRIAEARSLDELWHLRAEMFSRIAQYRDQAEAARRLALLDRHFPGRKRARRALSCRAGEASAGPGGR